MKVLVVENDTSLQKAIVHMLDHEGFHSYGVKDPDEAVELVKIDEYAAILWNVDVRKKEHFDALSRLRASKIDTPVITAVNANGHDAKVRLLNLGADDCIERPFHKDEIVARLKAITRRAAGASSNTMFFGGLCLDTDNRFAFYKDEKLVLTGCEYLILELLVRRKNSVVTKNAFLDHLYGQKNEPTIKVLDVFVCKLRRKLAKAGFPKTAIQTVWGRGYMMS